MLLESTTEEQLQVTSEAELIALAYQLGASKVRVLAGRLAPNNRSIPIHPSIVDRYRDQIRRGEDPLGQLFQQLRSAEVRREQGAVYTPATMISAMLRWAHSAGTPSRVVDPGSGSARFLLEAANLWPSASLVAVELDPIAATLAAANIAVLEHEHRSEIYIADFCSLRLPRIPGQTLFVGNPPYVRHHSLAQGTKDWLVSTGTREGLPTSQLAGLHVYFFLATAVHARLGDYGCYVTSAEWLDVNYGALVRRLFTGNLGGVGLHILEPESLPFENAATTAAITCFRIGVRTDPVIVSRSTHLSKLGALSDGFSVSHDDLNSNSRWSPLTRSKRTKPSGMVELGELCRVHRGQVTGANAFWIADAKSAHELPKSVLFPTVTRALELYRAGTSLNDPLTLRQVIDLPPDLDLFDPHDRKTIEKLLRRARVNGVHLGYVARHRKAWWSVGLHTAAPILATYMARRPPGFSRNLAHARHINVAHGLYPRDTMPETKLASLVAFLSSHVSLADGRVYAGGLTKYEPREMERLLVPALENL